MFKSLVLVGACLIVAPQASMADIVFTEPGGEGFVRDGLTAAKDGNPDLVVADVGGVQVLNSDRDTNPFEDRGIMEFDISSITTVDDARLVVFGEASNGPFPFNIDVYRYDGDGVIGLNDFNAGTLFTSVDYNGEFEFIIDITSLLQAEVAANTSILGFNFRFTPASSVPLNGPFVTFGTRGFGSTPGRIIFNDPIPEPGTLALMGLGGMILLSRRRGANS